jgi:hypothetical protein
MQGLIVSCQVLQGSPLVAPLFSVRPFFRSLFEPADLNTALLHKSDNFEFICSSVFSLVLYKMVPLLLRKLGRREKFSIIFSIGDIAFSVVFQKIEPSINQAIGVFDCVLFKLN